MFYRYVNEMGVLYGVTYRSKFSQVIFPIEPYVRSWMKIQRKQVNSAVHNRQAKNFGNRLTKCFV